MAAIRLSACVDPLDLHRHRPERYPCLLQSAAFERERGRYDVLLAFPQSGLRLDRDGITRNLSGESLVGGFPDLLDAAWQASASALTSDAQTLPFAGGWALFLSYELGKVLIPGLDLPESADGLPLALALRCPAALVIDRENNASWLIAEDGHAELLEQLRADLDACAATGPVAPRPLDVLAMSEPDDGRFLDAVQHALDSIAAGDAEQINLSRRWELALAENTAAADVFAALRQSNPAPFAGLFAWDDWAVLSSSPERLLSVRKGIAETRPIAGTRPRLPGDDAAARIDELINDPKERGEHAMLVDLEHGDLEKICVPGSVETDEFMVVESYTHVHHIVSNVRGRLRDGVTPGEILRAVFPGGSITGCPKIRSMELIAELEGQGRGAYTGSFGYLGHDGSMDLNVLIRSLVLQNGRASLHAGAGIVADSQPAAELAEVRAKARGVLRAFGVAG